jgi:mono/diheme cytochrome c family protein
MSRALRPTTVLFSVLLVIGVVCVGALTASYAQTPAAATPAAPAPTPTPLTLNQLSAIQPGLGTVMIEYGRRMAAVWWGGEAANWDMAAYQIIEMLEIQETGETTRPARADALKAFETGFLDPLDKAVAAKDKAGFEKAYKAAIAGCNACHTGQTSAAFPKGYGFIQVKVPTSADSLDTIYVWKAPTPTPASQKGAALFASCAGCHGDKGQGGAVFKEKINLPEFTDDHLRAIVKNGQGSMPGFSKLSAADIDAIIAFMRSWKPSPAG